jgi:hypothetical protein
MTGRRQPHGFENIKRTAVFTEAVELAAVKRNFRKSFVTLHISSKCFCLWIAALNIGISFKIGVVCVFKLRLYSRYC